MLLSIHSTAWEEDIDVRCMGRGRPFVIELKEPKIRTCDYSKLQQMVNEQAAGAIEVTDLRNPSNRSEVMRRIKDTPTDKSYTIRFRLQPMNELEYNVLIAPLDLTKVDKNSRKRKLKRR